MDESLMIGDRDPMHVGRLSRLNVIGPSWCNVRVDDPMNMGYVCSRTPGHAGRHVASSDYDGIVGIGDHTTPPEMRLPEGF